jgi:predicted phage tail component-like protein
VIIKGVEVKGDVQIDTDINIIGTLQHGDKIKSQSIVLSGGSEEFSIGGDRDKWGFDRVTLDNLSFIIAPTVQGVSNVNLQLKNVTITIYYIFDETGGADGFTLDGVHSREYSIFLTPEEDRPEGLNTDMERSKLTMSDGDKLGSMTITGKEIQIKFLVLGDTREEMIERLRDASTWLTSARTMNKKPVLKELKFDKDEDRIYDVVLNGEIKVDKSDVGVWYCTVKFLCPSGTARTPTKITGAIGRNNGITPVKPVLTILCTGGEVRINESYTGQYLKISNNFTPGTILNINIRDRKILDDNNVNWITSVSFDSYLITILEKSNYDFMGSENCIIQKVEFEEAY